MKKILLAAAFAALTGCITSESMMRHPDGAEQGAATPAFAQFNDIPIPEKASMDLKQTLLFGGEKAWFGRLVFTVPYSVNGMFDFYMAEMPKFGWKELTVVRSKISVMSFSNKSRYATVQIEQDMVNGSTVSFTVSPESLRPAAPKKSSPK